MAENDKLQNAGRALDVLGLTDKESCIASLNLLTCLLHTFYIGQHKEKDKLAGWVKARSQLLQFKPLESENGNLNFYFAPKISAPTISKPKEYLATCHSGVV